ncbi:hypothetical protein ACQ4PT_025360 [Festuca glaucescens]
MRLHEIIDEGDEKLVGLKEQLREEVYQAVITALVEVNEYNASGSCVSSELWNKKENKRARMGEVVDHILKQWGTVVDQACQEKKYDFFDSCSHGEAALSRETVGQPLIKVEIIFPYENVAYSAKKHDTMQSIMENLGKQALLDSYYLCGGRLLDCTRTFADSNISSGCRIIVNPRLRGGVNGVESSVGIQLTKVSFFKHIQELEDRRKWLMVVEVPEDLRTQRKNIAPYVVMLGIGGSSTLRQILLCFE